MALKCDIKLDILSNFTYELYVWLGFSFWHIRKKSFA